MADSVAGEVVTVIRVARTKYVQLVRADGSFLPRPRIQASAANAKNSSRSSKVLITWDLTIAEQRAMIEELDEVRPICTVARRQRSPQPSY